MKFIDLAVPFQNGNPEEKGFQTSNLQPEITYEGHEVNAKDYQMFFGLTQEQWPEGSGWETIKTVAHAGTHIDAPFHFYPTTLNGEKKAPTIDELPLDWFFNDAFVLDLTDTAINGQASLEDVKAAVEKINYTIKPMDIVCLRFDHDKHYGTAKYWPEWPGISAEAAIWLLEQGVKVIGTDSLGQDYPFSEQKKAYDETHDLKEIWPVHRLGAQYEFCNMEKLANLDQLPTSGFKIACQPIPIKGGSGAWCRPMAIIED